MLETSLYWILYLFSDQKSLTFASESVLYRDCWWSPRGQAFSGSSDSRGPRPSYLLSKTPRKKRRKSSRVWGVWERVCPRVRPVNDWMSEWNPFWVINRDLPKARRGLPRVQTQQSTYTWIKDLTKSRSPIHLKKVRWSLHLDKDHLQQWHILSILSTLSTLSTSSTVSVIVNIACSYLCIGSNLDICFKVFRNQGRSVSCCGLEPPVLPCRPNLSQRPTYLGSGQSWRLFLFLFLCSRQSTLDIVISYLGNGQGWR